MQITQLTQLTFIDLLKAAKYLLLPQTKTSPEIHILWHIQIILNMNAEECFLSLLSLYVPYVIELVLLFYIQSCNVFIFHLFLKN